MTELAAWYQKKIGTYDKQEWETTIEQRILHGLTQVPLKSAKLRPDLIDVDLIRGSSFPKAKPVQGLGTVVRLALARVLLLPVWMSWWAAHTSTPAARLLLVLWLLQCINTVLYFIAPASVHLDATCILVPLFLMAGLGVVHALIVSTAPPRPPSHRYRSLSNDERRQRCRLSVSPERGILRKDNLSPDALLLAPEISQKNEFYSTEEKDVTSVSTQTQEIVEEDKTEEKQGEWRRDFRLPSVSLTPPSCGQSVSFVLGGRRLTCGESSREDEGESPVHVPRQRNENPRNPTASAEGDDGFESLNGNNSNGSENGDELVFYGEDDEVKDGHESDEENEDEKDAETMNLCDKIPNGILYESKLRKRIKLRKCDLDEKSCDREGEENRDKWTENNVVFEDVSIGSESTVRLRGGLRACSDGGSSTNLSAEQDNRRERRCKTGAGVRFRNSWVQELLEHRTSLTDGAARKTRKDCTSCPSSSEEECDTASASLGASQAGHTDWIGQTTNSEECSYSSEPEESEWEGRADPSWEPCAILSPASDRVSCTIWERGRVLKAPLSAVDISRAVVHRAERALSRCSSDLWPGPALLAPLLAALPIVTRLIQVLVESEAAGSENVTVWDLPVIFFVNSPLHTLFAAFGSTIWERIMNLISAMLRLGLGALVFFLLAVAERAFRQRFFYAKLFSHLTSARRARQSSLPHFRLNRVRNIKTWLSVRSYLKRRGPQRSVDVIVSAAFFMMVLLISYLVIELLKENGQTESSRTAEALGWALALGAVLLRLAALGTRAARKHRCLPVLLTEQINLHLAMERRPASKERLAVANNVLKLASDLLKELESPFKISGLSANPYLYTITKVVVLSALSGVLSEILGFKLKLHKIKIK